MMLFVGSLSFIPLPSFMFVSAVVSEIREFKQNKEKKEKMNSESAYMTQYSSTVHIGMALIWPELKEVLTVTFSLWCTGLPTS